VSSLEPINANGCSGVECQLDPTPGNECKVVAGLFSVYTEGMSPSRAELEEEITANIESSMNSGEYNNDHPSIVRVAYLPEFDVDAATGDSANDPNQVRSRNDDGPNTGVIVGASVGAVLILGMVVLYRRRRASDIEDEEFNQLEETYTV